jgi:hypothetical protein
LSRCISIPPTTLPISSTLTTQSIVYNTNFTC